MAKRDVVLPSGADPVAMGERIREARKVLGIQTTELAIKWDFTSSALSYTERGKNGPSYRLLYALKKYGVSSDWILTGEGTMTCEPGSTRAVPVPLISSVGCGSARQFELLESPISLPASYVRRLTDPVVCRAAGRSMMPVVLPGDYAVVDRAERPRVEINTRDIYLVDAAETGEEVALTLKYVQLLPGILRLKPLNTMEYTCTDIPIDGTPLASIVLGVVALVVRDNRNIIPEK